MHALDLVGQDYYHLEHVLLYPLISYFVGRLIRETARKRTQKISDIDDLQRRICNHKVKRNGKFLHVFGKFSK